MNRLGLMIALAVAVVVGVVFAVWPRLDIDISALFFDPTTHSFRTNAVHWSDQIRSVARWLIAILVAPAAVTVIGKYFLPRRRILIDGRVAFFLVATLALGPGLITNIILKDHWGRERPIDIAEFGGDGKFTPWWDPRGACPYNCSFVAGEPAGAFWTLAPAALAPPQWRALAYAGALAFGTGIGALRVTGGGHFFTDVVFAGVVMYVLIWVSYRLMFNRSKRKQDG
jgi:membrane-associated PAP2 superfamily phosphatase